jgi:hypothetical protein
VDHKTANKILDTIDDGWLQMGCSHIAIVSISPTECQCMDCLRKWKKEKDFKSDWPQYDRE